MTPANLGTPADESAQGMDDHALLVECELTAIDLFGFDTYKHENRARAAALRAKLEALDNEAEKRGLKTVSRSLTTKGQALNPQGDPKVVTRSEENRRFIRNSH